MGDSKAARQGSADADAGDVTDDDDADDVGGQHSDWKYKPEVEAGYCCPAYAHARSDDRGLSSLAQYHTAEL